MLELKQEHIYYINVNNKKALTPCKINLKNIIAKAWVKIVFVNLN